MTNPLAEQKKSLRAELLRRRRALSPEDVEKRSQTLVQRLIDAFVAPQQIVGRKLALYWPIHNEPDLRPLAAHWRAHGGQTLLPVALAAATPLVFRLWEAQTPLRPDACGIPAPAPDAETLLPDIVLAPLCGVNAEGFRLGYGGGFYDRTLAALHPRPLTIGAAFELSRAEFSPAAHDVPLDALATEAGFWRFASC
ncbi:MAG: 5-formyltetrahydrofolate cyclo-ligase [Zoogloeaceae bacterium]|jgi:5,10-methenyltetrahydrofolate synthetase|nr:5-formyltetrahydrofolate cyclo-ligase [Zoogloeaceae bacterium]